MNILGLSFILYVLKLLGTGFKILCECGNSLRKKKVEEMMKKHDRDIRLACTQTSPVSECCVFLLKCRI